MSDTEYTKVAVEPFVARHATFSPPGIDIPRCNLFVPETMDTESNWPSYTPGDTVRVSVPLVLCTVTKYAV